MSDGGKKLKDLIYTSDIASGEALSMKEYHVPRIALSDHFRPGQECEVHVKVGPHPNSLEHSIRRISLFFYEDGRAFNPVLLSETHLAPVYADPGITVKVKFFKPGILYAVGYCNLHGLWESEIEIKF